MSPGRLPRWLMTPWWRFDSLAAKQRSLLRVLSVAVSERLPLAPLVSCLSMESRGWYRRRLYRLAQRLLAKSSLADALEQTPGVLSDEQILAIRFGDQSGTLRETLADLLNREDQSGFQVRFRLRQMLFYGGITVIAFVPILTFLLLNVVPTFRDILSNFYMEMPEPLELLIAIGRFAVTYWFLIALFVLTAVWLFRGESPRRFFRRTVLSRVVRAIAELRSADLLDLLAVTMRSGRPLAGALSTLARYHFDSSIRQKLLFVRNEVELGASVWQSMSTVRLITPAEERALECSTSTESHVWSMRRFAQLRRERVTRRIDVYMNVLQPILTLLLGAAVLFVAVACLSPLFQMISGLA